MGQKNIPDSLPSMKCDWLKLPGLLLWFFFSFTIDLNTLNTNVSVYQHDLCDRSVRGHANAGAFSKVTIAASLWYRVWIVSPHGRNVTLELWGVACGGFEVGRKKKNSMDTVPVAVGAMNLSVWINLVKNARHMFRSCFQRAVWWQINVPFICSSSCLARHPG